MALKEYMTDIKRFNLISRNDEISLGEMLSSKDKEEFNFAFDELVTSNLKLVVKIANDFINSGVPIEDLVSMGNIGLLKATENYDPNMGTKFSTYVSWWIKQEIRRRISHECSIRVPYNIGVLQKKIYAIQKKFENENRREATAEELSKLCGMTPEKVNKISMCYIDIVSMEDKIGEDGSYGDMVESNFECEENDDVYEEIMDIIKGLTNEERKIIEMRFGINGEKVHTLKEIGKIYGKSAERIRQLQENILEKIRRVYND